jgi:hypothetical protein
MKRSKFTDEQILAIVKEGEAGRKVADLCRANGITSRRITAESFNGKFPDECLNEHWFVSLADPQAHIEAWRIDYNTVRPHSALDDQTPQQFAVSKVGARRPGPARLNEEPKPGELSLSV